MNISLSAAILKAAEKLQVHHSDGIRRTPAKHILIRKVSLFILHSNVFFIDFPRMFCFSPTLPRMLIMINWKNCLSQIQPVFNNNNNIKVHAEPNL